eukprot:m.905248 g.905248  ORF g.905248 m.905248 type:complete len:729 (-) comp23698_c0_seq2:1624-3810(-)
MHHFAGETLTVYFRNNKAMSLAATTAADSITALKFTLDLSLNNITNLWDKQFAHIYVQKFGITFDDNNLIAVSSIFELYKWNQSAVCNGVVARYSSDVCSSVMSTTLSLAYNELTYAAVHYVLNSYTPEASGSLLLDFKENLLTFLPSDLFPLVVPNKDPTVFVATNDYTLILSRNPMESIDETAFDRRELKVAVSNVKVDLSDCSTRTDAILQIPSFVWCSHSNMGECTLNGRGSGGPRTFNISFDFTNTRVTSDAIKNITRYYTSQMNKPPQPPDAGLSMTIILDNTSQTHLESNLFEYVNFPLNLSLAQNALTRLPPTGITFPGWLLLGYNRITALTSHSFPRPNVSTHGLRYIDLSHNELSSVAADTFGTNSMLQGLDLSFNKLSVIPVAFLVPVLRVAMVNLAHNYLWALPASGLQIYDARMAVDNEIRCDTYFPELDQCSCASSGLYFGLWCGYGRCLSNQPNSIAQMGCTTNMSVYSADDIFVTSECNLAPYTDCHQISTCATESGIRVYQIKAATLTTDNICAAVTACDVDFHNGTDALPAYEVYPPTTTSDRLCSICSRCESGFSTTKCTATSNTECSKVTQLSTGDIAAIVLTCTIVVATSMAIVAYSTVMKACLTLVTLRVFAFVGSDWIERCVITCIASNGYFRHGSRSLSATRGDGQGVVCSRCYFGSGVTAKSSVRMTAPPCRHAPAAPGGSATQRPVCVRRRAQTTSTRWHAS